MLLAKLVLSYSVRMTPPPIRLGCKVCKAVVGFFSS